MHKWKRRAIQRAERKRIKNIWVSVRGEMAFQKPLISVWCSCTNILPFNKRSQIGPCFCCFKCANWILCLKSPLEAGIWYVCVRNGTRHDSRAAVWVFVTSSTHVSHLQSWSIQASPRSIRVVSRKWRNLHNWNVQWRTKDEGERIWGDRSKNVIIRMKKIPTLSYIFLVWTPLPISCVQQTSLC